MGYLRKGVPSWSFPVLLTDPTPPASAVLPSFRGGDSRSAQSSAAAAKKAKWKQQSDQLRAAMRANRMMKEAQANGQDIKSIAFQAADPEDDDRCGNWVGKVRCAGGGREGDGEQRRWGVREMLPAANGGSQHSLEPDLQLMPPPHLCDVGSPALTVAASSPR